MTPMNLVTMIVFNYLLIYTCRGWELNLHMSIYIQSLQYLHYFTLQVMVKSVQYRHYFTLQVMVKSVQ